MHFCDYKMTQVYIHERANPWIAEASLLPVWVWTNYGVEFLLMLISQFKHNTISCVVLALPTPQLVLVVLPFMRHTTNFLVTNCSSVSSFPCVLVILLEILQILSRFCPCYMRLTKKILFAYVQSKVDSSRIFPTLLCV